MWLKSFKPISPQPKEFIGGARRLKGTAQSIDLVTLMRECGRLAAQEASVEWSWVFALIAWTGTMHNDIQAVRFLVAMPGVQFDGASGGQYGSKLPDCSSGYVASAGQAVDKMADKLKLIRT